jgi:hypothetical protein
MFTFKPVKSSLCIAALVYLTACSPANLQTDARVAPVDNVGQLFGLVCQEAYPDIASARKVVQQQGFILNPLTDRFEKSLPEIQVRIDAERCSVRFLTNTIREIPQMAEVLKPFSQAATPLGADLSEYGDAIMGAEVETDGLVRVAVNRINEN